ncbi:MAG: HD domain-containing protein [Candidatus Peregrinibacteria bacterium]
MNDKITPAEAGELLDKYIHENYLKLHSRETEVIMRGLAKHFGEDEDFWGVTGLLHDLDFEDINQDPNKHGNRTVEILKEAGYDIPEMFHAILSHCEEWNGVKRESKLDFCLSAAENLTGLISAYILMRPDKKIEGVEPKSINKKFKDKAFAAKVSRAYIADIEKAGLERNELFQIALNAMGEIAEELGM